jgi:hypothetical protein
MEDAAMLSKQDSPNPKTRIEMKLAQSVASIQPRKAQTRSTRLEAIPLLHNQHYELIVRMPCH